MKKSLFFITFAFLFVGSLTSCASILGSDKTVELSTNPVNPTVIVYDQKGTAIETVTTSDKISFKKAGNYTVEFNKADYMPETISIKKKFNHSFWLNFLVGGIGVSSALISDPKHEFQLDNYYALAGYGVSIIGIVGIFIDIFSGSLVGITPKQVNISLKLTPEGMVRQEAQRQEELTRQEAQRQEELARQEAQRQAKEAERLAREEARRRTLENFIIVPLEPADFTAIELLKAGFEPADYTSRDLFRAVSDSRNLPRVLNKEEAFNNQMQSAFMLGMGGSYILMYKSDLTFVRQNGTDITFSSDDNTITQNMFIDQRSGLQAGQRVRVYYIITRSPLITWDVVAIERR